MSTDAAPRIADPSSVLADQRPRASSVCRRPTRTGGWGRPRSAPQCHRANLCRAGGRRVQVGRRWQPVHRLRHGQCRVTPRPRPPGRGLSYRRGLRTRLALRQRPSGHARVGPTHLRPDPIGRAGALHQLRHGGHNARAASGTSVYRSHACAALRGPFQWLARRRGPRYVAAVRHLGITRHPQGDARDDHGHSGRSGHCGVNAEHSRFGHGRCDARATSSAPNSANAASTTPRAARV